MGQPSREDLLGYLLGALEPEDHRRVDRALSEDDRLRDALSALRQELVPLARVEETEPQERFPAGLARRTCEVIARESRVSADDGTANGQVTNGQVTSPLAATAQVPELSAIDSPQPVRMTDVSHQRRLNIGAWTLADYVIASTVAVLVLGMITPALLASRNQSRLLACQDNLRRIGTGLYNYAENHEDRFIGLTQQGPLNVAGAYAPVLMDDGYVDQENVFFCSAATNQGLHPTRKIPTRAELMKAYHENNDKLAQLQAVMGGSYGYTLGYYDDGDYICPVNLGRSFRVIMADAPSYGRENNASANHGGTGQNLLFEDGSIQFARKTSIGFPADSIFENRNGLIAAGMDVNDSVIGSSNASAWISQMQ